MRSPEPTHMRSPEPSAHFQRNERCIPLTPSRSRARAQADGSTRHVELDISDARRALSYDSADNVAVCPENRQEQVQDVAARMGIGRPLQPSSDLPPPLPGSCTGGFRVTRRTAPLPPPPPLRPPSAGRDGLGPGAVLRAAPQAARHQAQLPDALLRALRSLTLLRPQPPPAPPAAPRPGHLRSGRQRGLLPPHAAGGGRGMLQGLGRPAAPLAGGGARAFRLLAGAARRGLRAVRTEVREESTMGSEGAGGGGRGSRMASRRISVGARLGP